MAAGAVLGIAIYALLQHAGQSPATAARAPATDRPDATASDTDQSRTTPPASVATPAPQPIAAPAPSAAATTATAEPVSDPGIKSAAPALGGDKSATAEQTDLLEARLAATRAWLVTEPHTTYSIQLMGANDSEQLREHLSALAKFVEINNIFVYRTVARQKPSLTVLYGSFTNPRAAREALDKLPESLKANRPLLRTVQGIRAEIRQHQAS